MTTRRLQQVHPPGSGEGDLSPSTEMIEALANDGAEIEVKLSSPSRWEGSVQLQDGRTVPFLVHRDGQKVHVWISGESYIFSPPTPTGRARRFGQPASDDVVSPMPGVVITVHVATGDTVTAGQDLVIVESMKTEQIVKSPRDGVVQRVSVEEGDRVDKGMRLVVLVPEVGEGSEGIRLRNL